MSQGRKSYHGVQIAVPGIEIRRACERIVGNCHLEIAECRGAFNNTATGTPKFRVGDPMEGLEPKIARLGVRMRRFEFVAKNIDRRATYHLSLAQIDELELSELVQPKDYTAVTDRELNQDWQRAGKLSDILS
jgi:hypothetical protein